MKLFLSSFTLVQSTYLPLIQGTLYQFILAALQNNFRVQTSRAKNIIPPHHLNRSLVHLSSPPNSHYSPKVSHPSLCVTSRAFPQTETHHIPIQKPSGRIHIGERSFGIVVYCCVRVPTGEGFAGRFLSSTDAFRSVSKNFSLPEFILQTCS